LEVPPWMGGREGMEELERKMEEEQQQAEQSRGILTAARSTTLTLRTFWPAGHSVKKLPQSPNMLYKHADAIQTCRGDSS